MFGIVGFLSYKLQVTNFHAVQGLSLVACHLWFALFLARHLLQRLQQEVVELLYRGDEHAFVGRVGRT